MNMNDVHFIGIGGIGVSAIARMILEQGKQVTGSDVSDSQIISELKKSGAKISIGHKKSNIKNPDLVVYTPALSRDNPELLEARRLRIPTFSYPEMLGEISKDKYTIAVSGSHGKTTTTAMIGKVLREAKLDPTIIVGSILRDFGSNFVAGKKEYFVVEACEYKRSFLNLQPRILVITNIDNDHLDFYKSIENIQKAFSGLVLKLGPQDYLVCNPSGRYMRAVMKAVRCQIIDYSRFPCNLKLRLPGDHNLNNVQAALAVAQILKIESSQAKKSLESFRGTWRRFEYKGKAEKGVFIYDDYAHHPTEIQATLAAAKQLFKGRKVTCIFQPHLFSRTKLLINDFAKSFGDADAVIITDIYAAREEDSGDINSSNLADKISQCHKDARYALSFREAADFAEASSKKGDIIFTMGAGDIYKVADLLIKR